MKYVGGKNREQAVGRPTFSCILTRRTSPRTVQQESRTDSVDFPASSLARPFFHTQQNVSGVGCLQSRRVNVTVAACHHIPGIYYTNRPRISSARHVSAHRFWCINYTGKYLGTYLRSVPCTRCRWGTVRPRYACSPRLFFRPLGIAIPTATYDKRCAYSSYYTHGAHGVTDVATARLHSAASCGGSYLALCS